MDTLRTQHEQALAALRPMAALATVLLIEAPEDAEFVIVRQIGGSDIRVSVADLSRVFDAVLDLDRPPLHFDDDRDATDLLRAYGIREFQNGVIRGDWSALDARCRAAIRYLIDEWDFMFLDEPPKEGE